MSNIHDISDRHKDRTYKTDECAGCHEPIEYDQEYTEVTLPSAYNDHEVTHIALCMDCTAIAKREGGL